jgi:photosystem II stability/assembly factor-like uncharacterized protein
VNYRSWICWFIATSCLWTNGAGAEPAAVVATDVPVTVGQTMLCDASLADVTFADGLTGWAVGDRGVVWHTADGGTNWHLQTSGVTCNLTSVSFLDHLHGWIAGGGTQPYSDASRGVLLVTSDGGATWSELEQATLPAIARVKFFDAKRGIAAGGASALFPSGVFTTHDGGRTWQPLPSDAGGEWLAADFPDAETGAFAGAGGKFGTLMRRRVVNSPAAAASTRANRALRLKLPTEGWMVGDGGLVLLTHDLGSSWQTPPGELPDYVRENFDFQAIATAGPKVWIAGSPGTRVFSSADGGNSWTPNVTGQNAPLRALTFVDERTGYAVGDLGTILMTNDGGRNWQIQRRGGERAALLLALAGESAVPLELVGKFGAEQGYLTAVSLLRSELETANGRSREALLLAGAAATNVAWQFPLPPDDHALKAEQVLLTLNRANDNRAAERLARYFVRQLRMWRPDVVVTHSIARPEIDPLSAFVEQTVDQALQAAADPNQFGDLAGGVGLAPWKVKKVYGVLPAGWRGEDRIMTGEFAPRLGATLADWVEPSRRIIHTTRGAAPEAVDLHCKTESLPLEAPDAREIFAGVRLPPGGDARRRLANLPSDDVDKLRRLATRRRQMRILIERSQGNAAWSAQVSHLTDELDPASAGALLYDLAEGYRAAGKLDLAADTYSLLARRQPDHPLVEPALRWLVQFYASGEAAERLADRDAKNYRPVPREETAENAANSVIQANAVATMRAASAPVIGLSRDDRLKRAAALGQYLEQARPALYAEPTVRFPLVVAQRQLGFANPAQRYFLTLHSLPENDPWRRCGQTEEWFAKPNDSPPPKKLGNCRHATERPHLDGNLDEAFWEAADRLQLRRESEPAAESRSEAKAETDRIVHPTVRFAYDREFLYVAICCPKAKGLEYSPDDRPRPRDADLAAHDRVVVRLDVDRDYTTAYELAIDDRGWTHDACWNDATWNPTWFIAAATDDATWTVEAAVPLAQLVAEPPAAKHVWAASVVRTIPRVGDETRSDETWSGDATSGDSPERFGLLIFE